jgi:hypothetical protein
LQFVLFDHTKSSGPSFASVYSNWSEFQAKLESLDKEKENLKSQPSAKSPKKKFLGEMYRDFWKNPSKTLAERRNNAQFSAQVASQVEGREYICVALGADEIKAAIDYHLPLFTAAPTTMTGDDGNK